MTEPMRSTPSYTEQPCQRCGHRPHWHRLDDSLNIPTTDPRAPFRCLGRKFEGCDQQCPDFVGDALVWHEEAAS